MKIAVMLLCAGVTLAGCASYAQSSASAGVMEAGLPDAGRSPVSSSSLAYASLPDAPETPNHPADPQAGSQASNGQTPAILAPWMTRSPLTGKEKLSLYTHQAFNPIQILAPVVPAAYKMINPPSHYPHDWKAGGDGFGREYGDGVARNESQKAGQFLAGLALHEDPRYYPSPSTNVSARVVHALAFTLVDKSDSKHNIPAFQNFAGAAAGGFVGMGYLPDGYRDATHAGQRSLTTMAGYAGFNVANEFCPQWAPIVEKLHIPFVHPSCTDGGVTNQFSKAATTP